MKERMMKPVFALVYKNHCNLFKLRKIYLLDSTLYGSNTKEFGNVTNKTTNCRK